MAKKLCDFPECIHNTDDKCTKKSNKIYGITCPHFEDYSLLPEYQHEYYIAIHKKTLNIPDGKYKEKRKGRRIEKHGMVFYSSEKTKATEDITMVTEEKTGYLLNLEYLEKEENLNKIIEQIKTIPPVVGFPEVINAFGVYHLANTEDTQ